MTASLTEQRPTVPPVAGDLAGLVAHFSPLIGEPFRFARITYGGELTLHFGELRPANSPKLPGHFYWDIHSGSARFAVASSGAFGLHLSFADGGSFFAQPAAPQPSEPGDEPMPALADWELTTPAGDLDAGPGPAWAFAARA